MKNLKKLTLLHSNDMHGDFLAEQLDDKLVGGVSMLSGYVNKVRREEKNALYCVAGDMFRGSVIDAEYKGVSTIEIMNMLAPDVVTLGNHEIDYGIAHLLFIEKCSRFPIINANLYIKTNQIRLFNPYHIVQIDGMKIMFIGILTEEVLAQTRQEALIGSFVDIYSAAQEVGRICNAYKTVDIDLTVLLTHIGFDEDKKLAALLDPEWGVDLIIGGHSHTMLEQPVTVNDVVIAQAGVGTDRIGRFDMMINTDTNSIDSYEWQLVPIDASHCPRDTALEELISGYKTETDKKYNRVVTRLSRMLTHPERTRETELGDLFADILRDGLGLDMFILGSGSIRLEKLGPIVTYGGLTEVFPYDDAVYMVRLTGGQLKKMIKHICRDEAWGGHTEFYQYSSGVHILYSKGKKELLEFAFNGEPVADDRVFTVGLQKFHFANFDQFFGIPMAEVEENGPHRIVSTSCRDILEELLSSSSLHDSHVEGRLVISD